MTTTLDQAHWQQRLDELVKKHGVPGAQLGILRLGAKLRIGIQHLTFEVVRQLLRQD